MIRPGEKSAQDPYEFVAEFLRTRERLPWKTSAYLCRVLRDKLDYQIKPKALERLLLERMRDGKVRYSQYPGRQSLDLIWGHMDQVGALNELWELDLNNELQSEIGNIAERTVPKDAEWVFLSHSFADFHAVCKLRNDLFDIGFGVWIAETEILHGERIVERVQAGLERAQRFALYASRRSLCSRWVLKEGGVAARRWQRPATVIVDRSDNELVTFFHTWVEDGWAPETLWRISELFPDAPVDPVAATDINQLLVAALSETVAERRLVVLYPERADDVRTPLEDRWHRTLGEAFRIDRGLGC